MSVSDIFISKENGERLSKLVKSWLISCYGLKGKRLEDSMSYIFLMDSPNEFGPEDTRDPDMVYVRKPDINSQALDGEEGNPFGHDD